MSAGSTFAERFLFARVHQAHEGVDESDEIFAAEAGLGSSSAITEYKTREDSPPVHRVLAIAERCRVDPGWLAFGNDSQAPKPEKFDQWLERRRESKHAPRKQPPEDAFVKLRATPASQRQAKKRRR